jgi:hypothetical protein
MLKFFKKILQKQQLKKLEEEGKALNSDPEFQSILEKYDIEPVYGTRLRNDSHSKVSAKPIKKKTKAKRAKPSPSRYHMLITKYGKELGERIHYGKQELEIDMTKDMLIDIKGKPINIIEKVSRGKVREEWYYDAYENRQKNTSYKFRVVLIDGKVDGWTKKK